MIDHSEKIGNRVHEVSEHYTSCTCGNCGCFLLLVVLQFVISQQFVVEENYLKDIKCQITPIMGRAVKKKKKKKIKILFEQYESGKCFRDYENFHKSVTCNSTHVTYKNECDKNCRNCLGVVSKIRGSCAPGHNGPEAGFSK